LPKGEPGMLLAWIPGEINVTWTGRPDMCARAAYAIILILSLSLLGGCGGGGSSGPGTGTVSMDIADAKPLIDGEQPNELWIVFDEVLAHTAGGGWASLDLPKTPFQINLLAFSDGLKTELAAPTPIPAGRVTQIRFVISRAYMMFYGAQPESDQVVQIDLDVPSGILRTDRPIDRTVENGGHMSLTVHFDLSRSVVRSGPGYKLKPVLHLFNNPEEAALICGSITEDSFAAEGDPPEVVVRVVRNGIETFTMVTVAKESDGEPTEFCVYWLVPLEQNESYTIRIDNGIGDPYVEAVEYPDLDPGKTFDLNEGFPISISSTI